MNTLRTVTLLFVIGLFTGGSAVAVAGIDEAAAVRQCARTLCFNLRNCDGEGGQLPIKEKSSSKDMVSKDSENTQGVSPLQCRMYALYEYMYCAGEGFEEDIRVKDEPTEKKATNVAPTND